MKKAIIQTAVCLLIFSLVLCAVFLYRRNNMSNDIGTQNNKSDAAFVSGKLDINKADAEQLMELPGIGDALAKRIIQYREENGPFQSIEELLKVKGLGKQAFSQFDDMITVADP